MMIMLDAFNIVLMGFSCFMFDGFLAIFIIPNAVMLLFFLGPLSTRLIMQKKLKARALTVIARRVLLWVLLAAALFAFAYSVDPGILQYILTGPIAIICWVLAVITVVQAYVGRKDSFLEQFYTGMYMEYITDAEKERYEAFIEDVEEMTVVEARACLLENDLSWLEQKALNERIGLLQSNGEFE